MKLKEVLDKTVQYFKNKNIETPRLDSEILLTEAMGFKNRVDLYLKYEQPLKDEELNKSRDFVRRRAQGEPVAYIIGKKDFYGYQFAVTSDVLIPRPETELLVEDALRWIQENKIENPRVLDLGCGSGCIGLALLKKTPSATLVAADKSDEALKVARKNAEHLELKDRSDFISSDVVNLNLEPKSFDIILGNPPYIAEDDPNVQLEVKIFEPHMALFSPQEGLAYLKSWSQKAVPWLKAKSYLGFEMGATQGEKMKEYFAGLESFDKIRIIKDLAGLNRHIIGEKNG